jgi:uncharacterized SAM-binding protein YcdF (DUF218 family)
MSEAMARPVANLHFEAQCQRRSPTMNEIFLTLGIESWKPLVSAVLIGPLPLLVMVIAGARLMYRRRMLAWLLILMGTAGLWMTSTEAMGAWLSHWLLRPGMALGTSEIGDLKRAPKTAIVVLGGGRRLLAPEYGLSSLTPRSIERLRYGIWLARETGLPLAFSGGTGHGAPPGPSEAEIAARIAEREFNRPLRWQEGESRDTRENAIKSVALLQKDGIERIVLVTHGYHMRRALGNFEHAAEGSRMQILAAPMGLSAGGRLLAGDWLPSASGYDDTWLALHEWVGRLMGA